MKRSYRLLRVSEYAPFVKNVPLILLKKMKHISVYALRKPQVYRTLLSIYTVPVPPSGAGCDAPAHLLEQAWDTRKTADAAAFAVFPCFRTMRNMTRPCGKRKFTSAWGRDRIGAYFRADHF